MKPSPILFPLFGYDDLVKAINEALGYPIGNIAFHDFPDQETVVRIDTQISGAEIIFVGSLDKPNAKLASLLFAAETAKELGATKVGLVTPYLPYMRQDTRFKPGEAITSKYFAKILSNSFDWMVTIDPHLHRWHALNEVFKIQSSALHATKNIADWIIQNVPEPVLIGPDNESAQWVDDIADLTNAPFLILEKERKGDVLVSMSIPKLDLFQNCTPIVVDDIVSSGSTMLAALAHLKEANAKSPICIAVHGVFAGDSYNQILKAGAAKIVSCNTVHHPSNEIDISDLIIKALKGK